MKLFAHKNGRENKLSLCQSFVDLSNKAWKEGDVPQHASFRGVYHESKMRKQRWQEKIALPMLWRIFLEAKVKSRFMVKNHGTGLVHIS